MMSLRRPSKRFPVLFSGYGSPQTSFAGCAGEIRSELVRLRLHPVEISVDAVCPLDFLALFRPDRRLAVLSGQAEYSDWEYAAAVRLASLYLHIGTVKSLDDFDSRISQWKSNPVLSAADGPPVWIRKVFSGLPADAFESSLAEKTVWNGIFADRFLSEGGTSLVYAAEYRAMPCVLKLPKPGREERFRHELSVLRGLDHPNLPKLLTVSDGRDPACVLELCHTGKCARESGKVSGFLCALKHLHASGFLHGDIRLSNLGIRADGSAVLLDFSHARRAASPRETELEMEQMKCLLHA